MKQKPQRLWAIVKRGHIVAMDKDLSTLGELLIFKHKWQAEAAKWKAGEKVIRLMVALDKSVTAS